MKKLLSVFILLLLFACDKENAETVTHENEILEEGFIKISGEIALPDDTTTDINSLVVRSTTDESTVVNKLYQIEVAEGLLNTLFVLDEFGEVILMGYNYPGQTDFTIDSKSTALGILMNLLPIQNLSKDGKLAIISQIQTNANYTALTLKLEEMMRSGISPLDPNQEEYIETLEKLLENLVNENRNELSNKVSHQQKTSETFYGPVKIFHANKEFIFQNNLNSFSSYVGIYKLNSETEEYEKKEYFEIPRVKFVPSSINELIAATVNGINGDINIVEESASLSEIGEYKITVRTGKTYPDGTEEAADALYSNLTDIAMDIFFGIVQFEKNGNRECIQKITGNFRTWVAASSGSLDNSFNNKGDLIGASYTLIEAYIKSIITDVDFRSGVSCSTNILGKKNFIEYLGGVNEFLGFTRSLSIIGTSANLTLGITQWNLNNGAMDLCIEVISDDAFECTPGLQIEGNLDFGTATVGIKKERSVSITNSADFPISISSYTSPEGFSINFEDEIIEPEETVEATVSFLPKKIKSYAGEIEITDDIEEIHILEAKGFGIKAFEISGNLDFGEVTLGDGETRSMTIRNITSDTINVLISEWPNRFTPSWTGGMILPNSSKEVQVTFIPEVTQAYGGSIQLSNDQSEEITEKAMSGTGVESEAKAISLSGDLNFGDVKINTSTIASLFITNESSEAVSIDGINLPEGFTTVWNTGSLGSGETYEVEISFSPTEIKAYAGTIEIFVSGVQEIYTIEVSGRGIEGETNEENGIYFNGDFYPTPNGYAIQPYYHWTEEEDPYCYQFQLFHIFLTPRSIDELTESDTFLELSFIINENEEEIVEGVYSRNVDNIVANVCTDKYVQGWVHSNQFEYGETHFGNAEVKIEKIDDQKILITIDAELWISENNYTSITGKFEGVLQNLDREHFD